MKKILCLIVAGLLLCSTALAAPHLSDRLFNCAKQAVGYLASGEYERLVTLLPFSDVAPSASEWQSFAGNFASLSGVQKDYAVAYWTGSVWKVAVPLHNPDNGSVEVLMLSSDDGSTFCGYRYSTWSQVESECAGSDHITWNKEYMGGSPLIIAD